MEYLVHNFYIFCTIVQFLNLEIIQNKKKKINKYLPWKIKEFKIIIAIKNIVGCIEQSNVK